VTTKNAVFWNVKPCGYCKNRRFGETYRLRIVLGLLVTADVVPRSQISSPDTSVLTRTTRYNSAEDGILHLNYLLQFLVPKQQLQRHHMSADSILREGPSNMHP
jgi:hypothetical protein